MSAGKESWSLVIILGGLLALGALVLRRYSTWYRAAVPDPRARWELLASCTPPASPMERCRWARRVAGYAREDELSNPPGGELGNLSLDIALVRSQEHGTQQRIWTLAHAVREQGRALFRDGHCKRRFLEEEVFPELTAIEIVLEEEYLRDHPPPLS